jgi:hypothetical protein
MVLQGWPDETVDTVNTTLRSFGIPEVTQEEFDQIEAALDPPPNFSPNSRTHKPTIAFLKAERVWTLWAAKKDDLHSVDIINAPQVKETTQLLLMGRFNAEEISKRVKMKYGKELSPRTFEAYRHYFWNPELVGMQELRQFLWTHPMRDAYIAAMWGSKNQALFRAGFSPAIDGRKALKEAHRNLAMRVEATRLLPDNKDTVRMLATLSKELVGVHNALYGEGAGVEDMMKELQRFIMERNAPNVVPITKLAPKGNFSGSGHKDKDGETG